MLIIFTYLLSDVRVLTAHSNNIICTKMRTQKHKMKKTKWICLLDGFNQPLEWSCKKQKGSCIPRCQQLWWFGESSAKKEISCFLTSFFRIRRSIVPYIRCCCETLHRQHTKRKTVYITQQDSAAFDKAMKNHAWRTCLGEHDREDYILPTT